MTTEGEWAKLADRLVTENKLLKKAIGIALEGGEHDQECPQHDMEPDPEEECVFWKGALKTALDKS